MERRSSNGSAFTCSVGGRLSNHWTTICVPGGSAGWITVSSLGSDQTASIGAPMAMTMARIICLRCMSQVPNGTQGRRLMQQNVQFTNHAAEGAQLQPRWNKSTAVVIMASVSFLDKG